MEKKSSVPGKGKIDSQSQLRQLQRLTMIAMFLDDMLMSRVVLKGGSLLDVVYNIGERSSLDVDLSMEDEFAADELGEVRSRLERSLKAMMNPCGYEVFDLTLEEKPRGVSPELRDFWGGYEINFKIISAAEFAAGVGNMEHLRRTAIKIGPKGSMRVDLSKFEYCALRQSRDVDGFRLYVYPPELIVCEKIRAICQQMPKYGPVVNRKRPGSARARDFFDVHALTTAFGANLASDSGWNLLKNVFAAKRVPPEWMREIADFREFHRPDFESVKAAVRPGVALASFDFYFDFLLELIRPLEVAGYI